MEQTIILHIWHPVFNRSGTCKEIFLVASFLSKRSKNKSTSYEVLLFLERCLPSRASDVAFGSDVHCVSDVSPCGEVGKHHITLRRRSNIIFAKQMHHIAAGDASFDKQSFLCYDNNRFSLGDYKKIRIATKIVKITM